MVSIFRSFQSKCEGVGLYLLYALSNRKMLNVSKSIKDFCGLKANKVWIWTDPIVLRESQFWDFWRKQIKRKLVLPLSSRRPVVPTLASTKEFLTFDPVIRNTNTIIHIVLTEAIFLSDWTLSFISVNILQSNAQFRMRENLLDVLMSFQCECQSRKLVVRSHARGSIIMPIPLRDTQSFKKIKLCQKWNSEILSSYGIRWWFVLMRCLVRP